MKKAVCIIILLLSISGLYAGGQGDGTDSAGINSDSSVSPQELNWSDSTHGNRVNPKYDIVFSQSEVLEFNIVIDSKDWQAMQDDLRDNLSAAITERRGPGARRPPPMEEPGGRGDAGNRPVPEAPPEAPPEGHQADASQIDFNPLWVPSSVTFEGITWDHVGIRFKGNSSLTSTLNSGNNKFSFKLDFDEFEDEYPEIENQRFYGFKQLNLNNNFSDESLMREKAGTDLFREFGLVSARTSFCVVNVDYGEGSRYFGVYTLVEEMDDTVIKEQFGNDAGNLYKPDGIAASFAPGTFNADQFGKKNNEEEEDYSDVLKLYNIVNSNERETDSDSWKSDLEEVFNVDGFLKWLAANSVIQNWDSYGNSTRNYFLYNNPETGLLNWIPWDHNEAFSRGKGFTGSLSLGMDEVQDNWPLIRNLIDDSGYKAVYDNYVEQFTREVFNPEKMIETYDNYFEMIKEYAYGEIPGYTFIRSDQAFETAVERLKTHSIQRNKAVLDYLNREES